MFQSFGNKRNCCCLRIFPAVLNALLTGADVAGTERYFLARQLSNGYAILLFF